MQKSPRIAEISTKVVGRILFYVHPVVIVEVAVVVVVVVVVFVVVANEEGEGGVEDEVEEELSLIHI